MLVRLVHMTFAPDTVDPFLETFDAAASRIRSFPGCRHLELWQDTEAPLVYTTYSHWTSAEALDRYRNSDLFHSTWSTVKPLFAERPEAHSHTMVRSAETIENATDGPDAPPGTRST